MITFSHTLDISRPIDEVHAYLADLGRIPEWNWALSASRKVTPGPVVPGTRYEVIREVPNHAVEELVVVAVEPPSLVRVEGGLGPFEARLDYQLEPVAGGTRLVNEVSLSRSMPSLARSIARIGVSRAVASNLETLRSRLEAGSEGGVGAPPSLAGEPA